jgi:hypothetical protein
MKREPFEVVATSGEPSAASALGRECKMLALNNFRNPSQWFICIHFAISTHEQPVVY